MAAPARSEDTPAKIENFAVKSGTTVTWRNADDIPHVVASTIKAFKSKVLDTNDKFSFTFATAGTYEYFCSLHPHMTGAVVVEAAEESNSSR